MARGDNVSAWRHKQSGRNTALPLGQSPATLAPIALVGRTSRYVPYAEDLAEVVTHEARPNDTDDAREPNADPPRLNMTIIL